MIDERHFLDFDGLPQRHIQTAKLPLGQALRHQRHLVARLRILLIEEAPGADDNAPHGLIGRVDPQHQDIALFTALQTCVDAG